VRSATRLSAERQTEWMQRIGLAQTVPRSLVKHKIKLDNGEVIDWEDMYKPVLDALEQAPLTLAELEAMLALKREGALAACQVAALLIAGGQASAYHVCDDAGNDSAHRLNRVMASMPHFHSANHVLVSPVLGNGILTSLTAQLVYRILCEMGDAASTDVLTNRVLHIMEAEGHLQGENTSRSHPGNEDRDAVTQKIHRILEKLVPVWRQLKVL
jgi:hypothetical protein